MKKVTLFIILIVHAYGTVAADARQQNFDQSTILLQEQINQIDEQVNTIRKLLEPLELPANALQNQNGIGEMIGGEMPQGADPEQLIEPRSVGAQLINRYCTQCHGLPTPGLHSEIGWPPVIKRMNLRMAWISDNNKRMDIIAPTPTELKTITEYMQKYARIFPIE